MPKIKNHSHLLEFYNELIESGTLEHPRNITFKIKFEHAIKTQDLALAQSVLDEYPYLYYDALRVIAETKRYKEHWVIGPPPTPEELPDLKGDIPISEIPPTGAILGMCLFALIQNLVIYGVPGTGKTWMTIQILRYILGNITGIFNTIIFDSKRDFIHLIREFPDLIVLKANKDFCINILEETDNWLEAIKTLCDENYFGDHSRLIIEEAYKNCLIKNGIMKIVIGEDGNENEVFTDSNNFPNFTELSYEVKQVTKKEKLQGNAFNEINSKVKIHLKQYIRAGRAFNCKKGFPLDFWRKNNIIIDTSGVNKQIMKSAAARLIHRIYSYNKDNNIRSDVPIHLFVFDEAGWWLGSEHDNTEWTQSETREDILRKGREFGIAFIFGFQQPNMATSVVRQNTRHKFTFQIESDSLRDAQIDFALTDEQRDYLAHKLPPKLVGIYKCPNFDRPIIFKVPDAKPMAKDVTFDEIDIKMKPILKELNKSVIPPEPVKSEYQKSVDYLKEKLFGHTRDMIYTLCAEPYLTKTELKGSMSGSEKQFETSLKFLITSGLIEKLTFSGTTKKGDFFPLTKKAHDVLGSSIEDRKRCPLTSHFKHRYFCDKCADHLKSLGYEPEREFTIKGMKDISFTLQSGDKGLMKCRVDVAANINSKWHGFEFMITDIYYLEPTLYKCIKRMKMDKAVIITVNATERDKTINAVKRTKIISESDKKRIQCMSTKQFFTKFKP